MRTLTNGFLKMLTKQVMIPNDEDILKKYLMNQSWLYKT